MIILHILCVHFWCVCMSVCVRVAYVVYVCVLCIISPLKIHVRTKEARAVQSLQTEKHTSASTYVHTGTHEHDAHTHRGQ